MTVSTYACTSQVLLALAVTQVPQSAYSYRMSGFHEAVEGWPERDSHQALNAVVALGAGLTVLGPSLSKAHYRG
ncbi:hypothetical protein PsorP6_007816 [Peronosclerospora sorghi]|uniref:Uncharacterized protein n=1 Tax=Peronosclerospora sorghi TaxID=230839 RepID=A0ACC0W975_9STRA|nr:hypothetical protein PsorP6_007816 [Peronosclerospora sorghi]